VLGGTFNPPHLGHLALALHARDELDLERVVLMPAHSSPFKPAAPDPGPQHRLRMAQLLIYEATGLSVCALEIDRGGVSYTVDTLSSIHASHPGAQLTFIVGADTATTLPAWREPQRVLELADLAVAAREGTDTQDLEQSLRALGASIAANGAGAAEPRGRADETGSEQIVKLLHMPTVDISSSAARARAARGEPLHELVGAAVARYIAEQRLYRDAGGAR
jgi:nicotinate-nucleotide adenylyltransferase